MPRARIILTEKPADIVFNLIGLLCGSSATVGRRAIASLFSCSTPSFSAVGIQDLDTKIGSWIQFRPGMMRESRSLGHPFFIHNSVLHMRSAEIDIICFCCDEMTSFLGVKVLPSFPARQDRRMVPARNVSEKRWFFSVGLEVRLRFPLWSFYLKKTLSSNFSSVSDCFLFV